MNIKAEIAKKTGKFFFGMRRAAYKCGPTGLVIVGLGICAYALYKVIDKANSDEGDETRECLADMEDAALRADTAETDDEKKDAEKEYAECRGSFLKSCWRCYRKPLLYFSLGAGAIVTGHFLKCRQFAGALGALTATSAALTTVEGNIRKAFGDDAVIAFRDREFDPTILQREADYIEAKNYEAEETGVVRPGYDDPLRQYATTNGERTMKTLNSFVFAKDTVEPAFAYDNFSSNLHIIKGAIDKAQSDLDYRDNCWFISRRELAEKYLHMHCDNSKKSVIMADATAGWCKGDRIDVNINGIYQMYCSNLSDRNWLDEMNKRYDRIPLEFNAREGRLYDAYLTRYVGRSA